MDNANIYAPPEADLKLEAPTNRAYYVVSVKKFLILSIATLGMYFTYWHFKNWQQIKEMERSDIWPVARAIFQIFFIHSLLGHVRAQISSTHKEIQWNSNTISTLLVICILLGGTIGQLVAFEKLPFYANLLTFAIFPVKCWLLVLAQRAINFVSGDEAGYSNNKITAANIFWISIGILFWIYTIYIYLTVMSQ